MEEGLKSNETDERSIALRPLSERRGFVQVETKGLDHRFILGEALVVCKQTRASQLR